MPTNSDLSSHGQSGGLSNIDNIMAPQQQKQQQYVSSQNSRMLQGFGSQRGAAMRSNMQQNIPTFGLSNVVSNGTTIGLTGSSSSMAAANRLETQDVYPNNASYATFNRQHLQQNIQTPSSQHQLLPMAGHGYSGSNMYGSGSSFVSTGNNQRINAMNLHPKPKTNHTVPTHHNSSMQQQQQPSLIKPQFDSSQQHMNLQASQTPQEYQMHPQNQMQNAQHQSFNQPLEPINHERSVQKQQQQQQYVQNQQQLVPKTEILRQNSATNFGGRSIQDHHHQSIESFKESLVSQPPEQLHMSESENQYQHIHNNDDSIGTSIFNDNTQFPESQDFQTSYSHGSQYMLPEQPLAIESQNEFSSLLNASQSDAFHQQNWQPQMRQQNDSTGDGNFLCDQQQQQQFHGVNNGHTEVQKQQAHISSDIAHVSALQAVAVPPHSSNENEDLKWKKQKKWLLLLLHSHKCPGSCKYKECVKVNELWLHMSKCKPEHRCEISRCIESKALINHFTHCSLEACPVCIPVKKFAAIHRKPLDIKKTELWKPISMEITTSNRNNAPSTEPNSIDVPPPSPKRMKTQQSLPSLVPKRETSPVPPPYMNMQSNALLDSNIQIPQQSGLIPRFKPEPSVEVKINPLPGGHHTNFGDQIKKENLTNPKNIQIRHAVSAEPLLVADEHDGHVKQEIFLAEKDKNKPIKVETKQEVNASHPDPISGSKSGKSKVKGVSMTELFTPEQINDHIISLRKWVGQSKAKVEKNQALERSMTENSCQLCAAEKLTFDPPPIYCTPCGARIKRNAMYYTIGSGDTRHYFCIPCYNEARGDSIQVDGTAYPKARLDKKKNDEETEEWWVQCDKCEAWQHQICALFNGRRNDGGQAEYTCPNCYVLEVKNGERKPLPQSAVLGAKDLPRTILSDHIEQRLFRRLKQEKQERSRHLGKIHFINLGTK